jgi:hypothetical protein
VTGVDDDAVDGDVAYTVALGAAVSTDPVYSGLVAGSVAVTNQDNDSPGISVTPTAGLVTSEAGATATFTVVLNSRPDADVVIPVSSSAPKEGTSSVSQLTFTAADWNVAETVTVTGVDDAIQDGDVAYTIALGAAASTDPLYAGLDATDVQVTNTDNDAAGIAVTPTAGLATSEAGGTATFSVVLTSEPTAVVTIPVSSNRTDEATVSSASLSFTATDWNVPQTVTVTGVDDRRQDGDVAFTIVLGAAVSTDAHYAGLDPADVTGENTDDDVADITVTPVAGLVTSEAGAVAHFEVALSSQPTADVIIPVSSSNTAEGTLLVTQIHFTPANWNAPQSVTVTGAGRSHPGWRCGVLDRARRGGQQ